MAQDGAPGREIENGDPCRVTGGVHAGRAGRVQDRNTSKTGHVTITVREADGTRFKTLARNVILVPEAD